MFTPAIILMSEVNNNEAILTLNVALCLKALVLPYSARQGQGFTTTQNTHLNTSILQSCSGHP